MSSHIQCLPSNPDISGIGVRTAVYAQNLLSFIPAFFALQDRTVTPLELDSLETQSTTILITAFAILLSVIVQALKRGMTNYHAAVILNLSWMNNTNLSIYSLLYAYHIIEVRDRETKYGAKERHIASFWFKSTQGKKAWRNPVFVIGSVHLSVMAAVGIWVWQRPAAFSDSRPCTLSASLVVVGQTVSIGSPALREWSLLIYSLLLTPVLNLVIPTSFFALPVWVYSRFSDGFALNRDTGIKLARAGLAVLAIINILLLADTEVAISKNKSLAEDNGDSEWTFGQTLALLLLLIPMRDISEALSERRAKRLGEKLLVAAENGELHVVQDAIKSGASRTGLDRAIITSINNRHWDIVECLIGTAANTTDICVWLEAARARGKLKVPHDAIYSAANGQHVQTLRLLAELKSDVNAKGASGCTALHYAARNGHLKVAKLLAEFKADASVKCDSGWTAAHYAGQNGHSEVIKLLDKLNADVNTKNNDGWTPLHYAAKKGHLAVVKLLVGLKADVNGTNNDGCTALHFAAQNGHSQIVKLLTEFKPVVKAKGKPLTVSFSGPIYVVNLDNNGWTALHYAAKMGRSEVVKLLVELRADPNAEENKGCTALHCAAENGHLGLVKLLTELKANVNAEDYDGWTALHHAAGNGHLDVVTLLATLKLDVSAKASDGCTALHCAAKNGHSDVIKLLAELKADLNAKFVKLLAELKADMQAKDNDGWTATHSAAENGHSEVIRLLAELKADLNAKDKDGWTALHFAARYGHSGVVKRLAVLKADLSAKDKGDWTPLLCAAANGHSEVVKLLVELGADLNARNNDGKIALQVAKKQQKTEVVDFLSGLQEQSKGQEHEDSRAG